MTGAGWQMWITTIYISRYIVRQAQREPAQEPMVRQNFYTLIMNCDNIKQYNGDLITCYLKWTDMENYYSLRHLGINAYAFPKKQALNIISKFLKNNVPILGGDVYCLNKGIITNSYDNWYCNLETGESQKYFTGRSCRVAKQ